MLAGFPCCLGKMFSKNLPGFAFDAAGLNWDMLEAFLSRFIAYAMDNASLTHTDEGLDTGCYELRAGAAAAYCSRPCMRWTFIRGQLAATPSLLRSMQWSPLSLGNANQIKSQVCVDT